MYDIGGIPQYVLRDPAVIKQVLVKQFDSFMNHRTVISPDIDPLAARNLFFVRDTAWREMRTTLSPSFTGSKMRAMLTLVTKCSGQFVDQLLIESTNEETDDVYEMKDTFSRYAADTIASCAFGLEVNSLADKNNDFFATGASLTEATLLFMLKFVGFSTMPRLMAFFRVRLSKLKDELYFREIVRQTIEYRQRSKVVRNDMIDLLLQARDGIQQEDGKSEGKMAGNSDERNQLSVINPINAVFFFCRADLSDTDFVAQCMIFFIAGFDTASALMCFMSHELAINPAIQNRLCDEIDTIHQSLDGKPITYEHLQNMPYMDMVVSESLRKWPPVGIYDRIGNTTTTLQLGADRKALRFDAGDGIIIPVFGLHRDPKYWPDPERFDPERFNETNVKNIASGTYLPFGIGPRVCIGQRFALMETKSLFYHLLSAFRLERCERTQHPLRLGMGITSSAEKGFWLQLKRR